MNKPKRSFWGIPAVQTITAALVCIVLGLLVGYIVLLFIEPSGAWTAITDVMKNFFTYSRPEAQLKYFGNTLSRTAPLLLCALSILFAYKVGLFNIGAAGQYAAGAGAGLYAALAWGLPWWACTLLAMAGADVVAADELLGVFAYVAAA